MSNVDRIRPASNLVSPPHPPCGHLLPRGEKGACAQRASAMANRRKSCALNQRNAHNGALEVRVEALTNKAAHYGFGLVRSIGCALFGLTSISSAMIDDICRERRAATDARRFGVRNRVAAAHSAENQTAHGAQQVGGSAHENARAKRFARSNMCATSQSMHKPTRFRFQRRLTPGLFRATCEYRSLSLDRYVVPVSDSCGNRTA